VRRGGKDAVGKVLAGRTETAYEAARSWASGRYYVNPIVIRSESSYMQPVYGTKVTCITLGRLPPCHWQASLRGGVSGRQFAAEVVVPAIVGKDRTLEPTGANHSTRMERQKAA